MDKIHKQSVVVHTQHKPIQIPHGNVTGKHLILTKQKIHHVKEREVCRVSCVMDYFSPLCELPEMNWTN